LRHDALHRKRKRTRAERPQRPPSAAFPFSRRATPVLADAPHRLQTGFCPAKPKGDLSGFEVIVKFVKPTGKSGIAFQLSRF